MLYDSCVLQAVTEGGSTWNPQGTWSDPVVFGPSAIPDWQ